VVPLKSGALEEPPWRIDSVVFTIAAVCDMRPLKIAILSFLIKNMLLAK
jgi:hypothetical protein